ncbi:MAG TPA: hypothetical protein VHT95_06480 [Vicinamibacterales bacterium]|nr:hypothetical protein [Vicinamibacterales bacterium]
MLFTAPGQESMIGGFMNVTFMADDVEATAWGTAAIFKDGDGDQFVLSTP